MTDIETPEVKTQTPRELNTVLTGGNPARELTGDYSCSYKVVPSDGRCRYWCKIIRAGEPVPMPEHVRGASDVPGEYLRSKDTVEVFAGDWILEGEENHHVKKRGWTYRIGRVHPRGWVNSDGTVDVDPEFGFIDCVAKDKLRAMRDETKDAVEKAELKKLLLGSGDVAAMIREIHYRRLLAR